MSAHFGTGGCLHLSFALCFIVDGTGGCPFSTRLCAWRSRQYSFLRIEVRCRCCSTGSWSSKALCGKVSRGEVVYSGFWNRSLKPVGGLVLCGGVCSTLSPDPVLSCCLCFSQYVYEWRWLWVSSPLLYDLESQALSSFFHGSFGGSVSLVIVLSLQRWHVLVSTVVAHGVKGQYSVGWRCLWILWGVVDSSSLLHFSLLGFWFQLSPARSLFSLSNVFLALDFLDYRCHQFQLLNVILIYDFGPRSRRVARIAVVSVCHFSLFLLGDTSRQSMTSQFRGFTLNLMVVLIAILFMRVWRYLWIKSGCHLAEVPSWSFFVCGHSDVAEILQRGNRGLLGKHCFVSVFTCALVIV